MNQSQMACPAYTHSSMNCFFPLSSSIGVCAAHGILHYSLSPFNAISGSTTIGNTRFLRHSITAFPSPFSPTMPKIFNEKKLVQQYIYFGEIFSIFFIILCIFLGFPSKNLQMQQHKKIHKTHTHTRYTRRLRFHELSNAPHFSVYTFIFVLFSFNFICSGFCARFLHSGHL